MKLKFARPWKKWCPWGVAIIQSPDSPFSLPKSNANAWRGLRQLVSKWVLKMTYLPDFVIIISVPSSLNLSHNSLVSKWHWMEDRSSEPCCWTTTPVFPPPPPSGRNKTGIVTHENIRHHHLDELRQELEHMKWNHPPPPLGRNKTGVITHGNIITTIIWN